MGKHVSLNEQQLADFKQKCIEGAMPADLAARFGIAISSVHNLRKKLKEEGIGLPKLTGKRKNGWIYLPRAVENVKAGTVEELLKEDPEAENAHNENIDTFLANQPDKATPYNIVINGTQFFISPSAKQIHINGKDSIVVNF